VKYFTPKKIMKFYITSAVAVLLKDILAGVLTIGYRPIKLLLQAVLVIAQVSLDETTV